MGEVMKNFIETVTSRSDMITEAFLQHIFLSFRSTWPSGYSLPYRLECWLLVIVVLQSQSSV